MRGARKKFPQHPFRECARTFFVLALLCLAACGGSHDAPSTAPASSFTVGGTVSGLAAGTTLTLENNGKDPLTVSANGAFTFALAVPRNGTYAVTVAAQPAGETCSVSNATGAGLTADVTSVKIVCSATTFVISGSVSGLKPGTQLELADNGADTIPVTADGAFAFPTPVPYDGGYDVTVAAQPAGETCSVTGFSGSGVTAAVNTVRVTCATATFSVSGTLAGLAPGRQVTLDDNGADPLTVNANGTFTFATPIAYDGSYTVTVGTQPVGQICSVTGGSGRDVAADVTGIAVSCSDTTFTIGGTLAGLGPDTQLTLTDNGGDALTLSANGPFTFATPVAFDGGYNVAVGTPASGQNCTVSNGVGTTVTANVGDINVNCVSRPEYVYVVNQISSSISQYEVGAGGSLVALTPPSVVEGTGHVPTSIAADPSGRFVYVTDELEGTLVQYSIGADGTLANEMPGVASPASGPTAVTADPLGRFVYTSSESPGLIVRFGLSDGALVSPTVPVVTTGLADPQRVAVDPTGRFAYVPDESGNFVSQFSVGSDGTLTPLNPPSVPDSNSPSALVVDPSGRFAYVVDGESTVTQYAIGTDGTLTPLPVPTVATGFESRMLAVDPSGRFLYVANLPEHAISQYSIGANGALTPLNPATVATAGVPNALVVDPSGRFVYAVNEDNGTISQYGIGADGQLVSNGQTGSGLAPVSIVVVRP